MGVVGVAVLADAPGVRDRKPAGGDGRRWAGLGDGGAEAEQEAEGRPRRSHAARAALCWIYVQPVHGAVCRGTVPCASRAEPALNVSPNRAADQEHRTHETLYQAAGLVASVLPGRALRSTDRKPKARARPASWGEGVEPSWAPTGSPLGGGEPGSKGRGHGRRQR